VSCELRACRKQPKQPAVGLAVGFWRTDRCDFLVGAHGRAPLRENRAIMLQISLNETSRKSGVLWRLVWGDNFDSFHTLSMLYPYSIYALSMLHLCFNYLVIAPTRF
jgi:hypothetical protein